MYPRHYLYSKMWTRKAEAQVTWLPGATLPLFFHYSLEFSITFTSSLLKWLVISMTTENSTSSRTSLSLKRKGILISRTFWLQISKISSYCMASFKVCFCNSPVALCVCVCACEHTRTLQAEPLPVCRGPILFEIAGFTLIIMRFKVFCIPSVFP